jgi:dihydroneopterin aldolase
MDKLVLKGLKFRGFHGYFDHERQDGNDFEVDLIFHTSLQKSAESDDLEQTIDYSIAREIVASVMNGESVKLIETLTLNIGNRIFEKFSQLEKLEVVLRKLNPPMKGETEYAEVTMSWPR